MRRIINSALSIIALIGGLILLDPARASAQVGSSAIAAAGACCSDGKVIICGDACTTKDGKCFCV